jgi:hypothetical protein
VDASRRAFDLEELVQLLRQLRGAALDRDVLRDPGKVGRLALR